MSLVRLLWRLQSLVLIIILLAACGQAMPNASSRATISLPTAAPIPQKTPTNTRVIPIESLTPGATPTLTPIPDEVRALVVGAIDGRTIGVVLEGDSPDRVYGVRYLGIDTPRPGGPWGIVAYETNRKLVSLRVVRLVRDVSDLDDEGYLLRYVFVGNELVNSALVKQGLARAAVQPPDTRFEAEILAAEAQAKTDKLGLWGGTPTPSPTAGPAGQEGTIEPGATITPSLTITVTLEITPGTLTPQATPSNETAVDSNATDQITDENLTNPTSTVQATDSSPSENNQTGRPQPPISSPSPEE